MKDTHLVDQEGFGFITKVFSRINCIVNEYHRETGIDALLEIRESPYVSSGKLIAIQLKSGDSYFRTQDERNYYYYADYKHIDYWLKCCLPVLLIIYSPSQEKAFGTKIDKSILVKLSKGVKVPIPKENDLSKIRKENLLELFYGKIYEKECEFIDILNDLKNLRHCIGVNFKKHTGIYISGLEIFINGLFDFCNQLYFDSALIHEIAEVKALRNELTSFSPFTDKFCIDYLELLTYHNLIIGDFSFEVETLFLRRQFYPVFLKPLSINGHKFCEFLREKNYPIHDRLRLLYSFYDYCPSCSSIFLEDDIE